MFYHSTSPKSAIGKVSFNIANAWVHLYADVPYFEN